MSENYEQNRHDKILSCITTATEIFLRGSLASWQSNVFQVLRLLGQDLGMSRVYLCKNEKSAPGKTVSGVRYEWVAENNSSTVDAPALQEIDLIEAGFSRWVEIFSKQGVIYSKVSDLPLGERGWFIGEHAKSIIAVPVFVEQSWWGFICLEDYATDDESSSAEIDAFKTVAVIFGAAIHRKRTEEALEREKKSVEQKAREIQDIARFPAEDPSPVMRVSKDGVILYANRAATPLLASWNVKLGEHVPAHWQESISQSFDANAVMAKDVEYGEQVFSVLISPVISDEYINLYGREVTKERAVDQMKSDFIAMASHQLRTPLTTIRWYSEKLLRKSTNLDEKQREWGQAVYDTAVQLAVLVDDLLNISRIERGKIEPRPMINNLSEQLQNCINEMKLHADKKSIAIDFQSEAGLTPFLFDADLIKQVIINLLSNAIKYTPVQGKVTVNIKKQDNQAVVEVTDTGIGIPVNDQANVFQRFYRASNASRENIEGTGLGLTFAKLIVEKSGGRIWFTSTENMGTTFCFSLPIQTEQQITNNEAQP